MNQVASAGYTTVDHRFELGEDGELPILRSASGFEGLDVRSEPSNLY